MTHRERPAAGTAGRSDDDFQDDQQRSDQNTPPPTAQDRTAELLALLQLRRECRHNKQARRQYRERLRAESLAAVERGTPTAKRKQWKN
jgi:hypothetical protein